MAGELDRESLISAAERIRQFLDLPLGHSPAQNLKTMLKGGTVQDLRDASQQAISSLELIKGHRYQTPTQAALKMLGARSSGSVPAPSSSAPASIDAKPLDSPAELGRLVRTARRSMRLSQQRFADMAGVGRRFVSELEAGKPTLEFGKVLAVCRAAGVDLLAIRR